MNLRTTVKGTHGAPRRGAETLLRTVDVPAISVEIGAVQVRRLLVAIEREHIVVAGRDAFDRERSVRARLHRAVRVDCIAPLGRQHDEAPLRPAVYGQK